MYVCANDAYWLSFDIPDPVTLNIFFLIFATLSLSFMRWPALIHYLGTSGNLSLGLMQIPLTQRLYMTRTSQPSNL